MSSIQALKVMRHGLFLALFTILFGYCLGGIFGGASANLKGYLKHQAQASVSSHEVDAGDINKLVDKSWKYFQRAHFHASGIGTTAVVLIILLSLCALEAQVLFWTSLALGLGSLGYSLYWLIAGFLTPILGSSEEAKEALGLLAIPSAGLCILGVVATMVLCYRSLSKAPGV